MHQKPWKKWWWWRKWLWIRMLLESGRRRTRQPLRIRLIRLERRTRQLLPIRLIRPERGRQPTRPIQPIQPQRGPAWRSLLAQIRVLLGDLRAAQRPMTDRDSVAGTGRAIRVLSQTMDRDSEGDTDLTPLPLLMTGRAARDIPADRTTLLRGLRTRICRARATRRIPRSCSRTSRLWRRMSRRKARPWRQATTRRPMPTHSRPTNSLRPWRAKADRTTPTKPGLRN